ncbi:Predicted phosphoribosyltransferase [Natronorubrum sediminis]|uniref:Predicted phosphoribosyltransferase n=1 Tax=Natronorubrum sediminis TaxID=640943 RepID=A0A1H6G6P2_9EURY|nr:phosphoribosyltransferase family protein [Natronorubrum sediminis]SEH18118.1 Predicted phosphoribosyltransferase [Natronorubrum sediminis]
MFDDRTDAGEHLAAAVSEENIDADVALAIPRGGLPLGRIVADELDVPLDVVVAKKIGAPGNPELAIGSVASDGSVWLNDEIISQLSVDEKYVEAQQEEVAAAASAKADQYRAGRDAIDLKGKRVIVVDDGVATGATTRGCLKRVHNADAAHITLAVPVGPPEAIESLRDEADTVVCVETPAWFGAVGQFYRTFGQVSDTEAMAYLNSDEQ